MAEYIKKQVALDAILSEPPDAHYPSWYAERIKALPAADVVPVVRCKDCKHLFYTMCAACGFLPHKPNDFCSYGERRDGGRGQWLN